MLRGLLGALDVDVHDYESAESYLAHESDALSCLITEVALPGMSGIELLRRLHALGMRPPVILLGEESDVRGAVAAIRAGAIDFIEKPRVDIAVVPRVAALLNRARAEVRH